MKIKNFFAAISVLIAKLMIIGNSIYTGIVFLLMLFPEKIEAILQIDLADNIFVMLLYIFVGIAILIINLSLRYLNSVELAEEEGISIKDAYNYMYR